MTIKLLVGSCVALCVVALGNPDRQEVASFLKNYSRSYVINFTAMKESEKESCKKLLELVALNHDLPQEEKIIIKKTSDQLFLNLFKIADGLCPSHSTNCKEVNSWFDAINNSYQKNGNSFSFTNFLTGDDDKINKGYSHRKDLLDLLAKEQWIKKDSQQSVVELVVKTNKLREFLAKI